MRDVKEITVIVLSTSIVSKASLGTIGTSAFDKRLTNDI
jgi:hypothetical protein